MPCVTLPLPLKKINQSHLSATLVLAIVTSDKPEKEGQFCRGDSTVGDFLSAQGQPAIYQAQTSQASFPEERCPQPSLQALLPPGTQASLWALGGDSGPR